MTDWKDILLKAVLSMIVGCILSSLVFSDGWLVLFFGLGLGCGSILSDLTKSWVIKRMGG